MVNAGTRLPLPIHAKKVSHPLKAYKVYLAKYPGSETKLPFDKFLSGYAALAGTRAGYSRIKKHTGLTDRTLGKIDSVFRLRSKALKEQITSEEKGRGKTADEVYPKGYVEDALALIGRKGKAELTINEIAQTLKEKYGVGERHAVAKIAKEHGARTAEEIKELRIKKTAAAKTKADGATFRRLLKASEIFTDPETGEMSSRLRYSLPEIAKKLGLSLPGTYSRWKREFLDTRTVKQNDEISKRKRNENLKTVLQSEAISVAVGMIKRGIKDEERIIQAMERY
ncbi:MAG: hypothetical protein NUV57_05175, partial [archaeon]|nr:hypothetical protein [archaeon]